MKKLATRRAREKLLQLHNAGQKKTRIR